MTGNTGNIVFRFRLVYIVFLLIAIEFSACRHRPDGAELINTKASIPASFHFDELGLKVISSEISHRDSTLSTLYGNDAARTTVLMNSGLHSKGELFAFVTWKQQPDEKWFGAIVPAELKTVELVRIISGAAADGIKYQRFAGKDLVLDRDILGNQDRIKYILNQKPSVLP